MDSTWFLSVNGKERVFCCWVESTVSITLCCFLVFFASPLSLLSAYLLFQYYFLNGWHCHNAMISIFLDTKNFSECFVDYTNCKDWISVQLEESPICMEASYSNWTMLAISDCKNQKYPWNIWNSLENVQKACRGSHWTIIQYMECDVLNLIWNPRNQVTLTSLH